MAYTQLTETERYQISSLKKAGFSQRFIAESLKRSPSTISRELKRNQEVQTYCPEQAHLKVLARRHFAKKAVKITPEVKKWIKRLIWKDLSPEQVADYLKQHKGIYMSSGDRRIYPIDLNNLEASLSSLKGKENWAALPFTGDYDMHDMISFTTQPHSVPSASLEEKKIIDLINRFIAQSDLNRPFEDIEHNVIRHGPQVSYPAFAMDKEREKVKKRGGIVKVVAEPGEFPVAIICKGKWIIANDIYELEKFYNKVGAKMKVSWRPGTGNPGFVPNPEKPGMARFSWKK